MSTSNWEDAKLRSNYHFNKWHKDTECVEHLGKFTGVMSDKTRQILSKPIKKNI